MRSTSQLVTAPTMELVTFADLKVHLHMDADDKSQDASLTAYLLTAIADVEGYTGMSLGEQTHDLFFAGFPCYGGPLELPAPARPVQTISSFQYIKQEDGVLTDLDATKYILDNKGYRQRPRIVPAWNEIWPVTRPIPNAVQIRVVCGFAQASGEAPAANVPAQLLHAIKCMVGEYNLNREAVDEGNTQERVDRLPLKIRRLLNSFRLEVFA